MAARILLFTLSAAALMMPAATSAQAAELDAMLDGEAALSDADLAGIRGGFLTAGGAQFDFGASIRTMVNGQVALQTSLQWTDAGAVTQQLAGLGQSIRSHVNDVVASNLAQTGINTGIASPVGNTVAGSNASDVTSNAATNVAQEVSAAASAPAAPAQTAAATAAANAPSPAVAPANPTPSTASASAPTVITGVEVPGVGGSTQVFANLSPSQIQSIILNSASGQNITQNTDITFMIYNFQAWQQQLAERIISARLANEMLAASGFVAGH